MLIIALIFISAGTPEISLIIFMLITGLRIFNLPVLSILLLKAPNLHNRIALIAVMLFGIISAFFLPVILIFIASLIYLFMSFALVYKRKSLKINAIISMVLLMLLAYSVFLWYDKDSLLLVFLMPPLISTMFAIFYASLLVSGIFGGQHEPAEN